MAISNSAVFECRNVADYAGAADTNGGGWVTGTTGTDYSYASLPSNGGYKYSFTCTTVASSASITLPAASATSDLVGNIAYISGTGMTAGWYQILTANGSTTITVDRSTGLISSSSITITIGGCFKSPGVMTNVMTGTGQKCYFKYSTTAYSITSLTAGATGGPLASVGYGIYEGYDQTRGDRTGNQPLISWSSSLGAQSSLTYMYQGSTGSANQRWANMHFDGGNYAYVGGMNLNRGGMIAIQCTVTNCNGTAAVGISTAGQAAFCSVTNCTTGITGSAYGCFVSGCVTGIGTGPIINCIVYNCTTTGIAGGFVINCTVDSTTAANSHGITGAAAVNCIASNQSATGASGFTTTFNDTCAGYNNATNVAATVYNNTNFLALTNVSQQPYVNPGVQFAPNILSGGLLLRGASIAIPTQTDNQDIGAVQHVDPSTVVLSINRIALAQGDYDDFDR